MAIRLGAKGEEVRQLQLLLRGRGFYLGAVDGDFGPGTDAAVRRFQETQGLEADGIVGPATLAELGRNAGSPEEKPSVPSDQCSLLSRCLRLTATFETNADAPHCFAGVAGNFDGMVLSFGALQWNFGKKTLQPLFLDLFKDHPGLMSRIFGEDAGLLLALLQGPHANLMRHFTEMQGSDKARWREWVGRFRRLGISPECIAVETNYAQAIYQRALEMCREYGLRTERAVALMFDICVQNGSIRPATKAEILTRLPQAASEPDRLVIIANCRAEAASAEWVEDVRERKLCIARGSGLVHKRSFELERDFQITLNPAQDLCAAEALAA